MVSLDGRVDVAMPLVHSCVCFRQGSVLGSAESSVWASDDTITFIVAVLRDFGGGGSSPRKSRAIVRLKELSQLLNPYPYTLK